MDILISAGPYGFGKTWSLKAYGKVFYLGQDAKFCSRVLGIRPRDIVNKIGTNRLDLISGRVKLARFICSELGINKSTAKNIEPWGLSAE